VVLLPSHYMANFHGYEWLIGTDRALDLRNSSCGNGVIRQRAFVVTEQHAGAVSRSRFPVTTIRDNVEAVHRLLTEELKVTTCARSSVSPWAPNKPSNGR